MKKILLTMILTILMLTSVNANFEYTNGKEITKVKISVDKELKYLLVGSDGKFDFKINGIDKKTDNIAGIVMLKGKLFILGKNGFRAKGVEKVSFVPTEENQILEILNWKRTYSWDKNGRINDNVFRGIITIIVENGEFSVINEIGIGDYMKGIAEVPENDSNEKRKSLAVISRSYVTYYSTIGNKFPGKYYTASDSPKVFQKYLGYGYELRSPNWQKALKDTEGEVLKYKGKVLRAAYSSCTDSSGLRKTASQAGWNGGYFEETKEVYTNVDDSFGIDEKRHSYGACGHQVGLSGFGATNMSKNGSNYKDILNHYYKKITIEK